jgi:hypothetical protein
MKSLPKPFIFVKDSLIVVRRTAAKFVELEPRPARILGQKSRRQVSRSEAARGSVADERSNGHLP